MKELPGRYRQFKKEYPAISKAYDDLGGMLAEAGPLDERQIQLIRLAMALASGQEGAVHSHTRRALEAGAAPDAIRHVGLLAMTTVGFPRMMAGLSWIDDVLKRGLGGRRKPRRKPVA